jgi:tryptophan halogenase
MEGPHSAGLPARRLRFEVGNLRAPWRANCVAIGLSAGFVEPLESTGLYLSEFGARMLLEYFPLAENRPGLAWMYNRTINQTYDEIVDFVALHYVLSARRDTPFWRAATEPSRRSERLAAYLDFWEAKPPSVLDFTSAHQLFSHQSYEFILYGMGWRPSVLATVREPLSLSAARAARLRSMAASLPDHEALIARLRAAA